MKTITAGILVCMITMVFSCKKTEAPIEGMITEATSNKGKFDHVSFSNHEDPVCHMTLDYGVSDTLIQKGRVIGFCSVGCKKEFAKNPLLYHDYDILR